MQCVIHTGYWCGFAPNLRLTVPLRGSALAIPEQAADCASVASRRVRRTGGTARNTKFQSITGTLRHLEDKTPGRVLQNSSKLLELCGRHENPRKFPGIPAPGRPDPAASPNAPGHKRAMLTRHARRTGGKQRDINGLNVCGRPRQCRTPPGRRAVILSARAEATPGGGPSWCA